MLRQIFNRKYSQIIIARIRCVRRPIVVPPILRRTIPAARSLPRQTLTHQTHGAHLPPTLHTEQGPTQATLPHLSTHLCPSERLRILADHTMPSTHDEPSKPPAAKRHPMTQTAVRNRPTTIRPQSLLDLAHNLAQQSATLLHRQIVNVQNPSFLALKVKVRGDAMAQSLHIRFDVDEKHDEQIERQYPEVRAGRQMMRTRQTLGVVRRRVHGVDEIGAFRGLAHQLSDDSGAVHPDVDDVFALLDEIDVRVVGDDLHADGQQMVEQYEGGGDQNLERCRNELGQHYPEFAACSTAAGRTHQRGLFDLGIRR